MVWQLGPIFSNKALCTFRTLLSLLAELWKLATKKHWILCKLTCPVAMATHGNSKHRYEEQWLLQNQEISQSFMEQEQALGKC
jgi:hypothetical protein